MAKKGQGLSVNMMILIVIGLIVLAISIFMFTKKSSAADQFTGNCESLGGVCKTCVLEPVPGSTKNEQRCKSDPDPCADTGKYFGTCGNGFACCSKPASTT